MSGGNDIVVDGGAAVVAVVAIIGVCSTNDTPC